MIVIGRSDAGVGFGGISARFGFRRTVGFRIRIWIGFWFVNWVSGWRGEGGRELTKDGGDGDDEVGSIGQGFSSSL